MSEKKVPFNKEKIEKIAEKYPTPFHIYDEKAIRENARRLKKAFSWLGDDFKEYFAVKATPNPHILKIMKDEGFGTDCSSLPELILSEKTGITGENIMFTSNETPAKEYSKAKELGAIINLDDITHINYLEEQVGLPELLSFRYNPGPLREGNAIIGNPEEAKYGFTKEQLFEGYRMIKEKGVKRFGIHTMVASNELNADYFVETVNMLVDLVIEIYSELGINFEFINMGGGIGIPYQPDQEPVDLEYVAGEVKKIFDKKIKGSDLDPLKLYMENGRMITGPYGYLVARAIHKKEIYKNYIGLDASMANLMRPGMYQAYHHVTVLGKENKPHDHTYDIVGSLCENNDKFAIDRKLPKIDIGDIIVIHDAGAHGHAMGFNYNGKLRSAELLIRPDGSVKQIRRAETIDDYFATLDFSDL
ncbi:MAG TPA: diaminopimelate decarboxylase [Flexistipes sinusarabici]|uniref:Diaminopimelate decarboxylase n=1 Tax=Flexistipes sinusarabici TaxID=2352 RepID=A0A3D5QCQ3_FLESI|nr:diaminopimelate decarboxylase [Flexistipes sinusarabici]